jgi:hypothetical protein
MIMRKTLFVLFRQSNRLRKNLRRAVQIGKGHDLSGAKTRRQIVSGDFEC